MRTFSDAEKVTAIRAYIVHGSFDLAQQATGIDRDTIASWKYRDPEFWEKAVAEVTLSLLSGCTNDDREKLTRIRSSVLSLIEKRLEQGDQKMNVKTGELVRVEIPAKELSGILAVVSNAIGSQEKPSDPNEEKAKLERQARFRQLAEEDRKPN